MTVLTIHYLVRADRVEVPVYLAADVERVLEIYREALKTTGYRKTCDCSKCVKATKLLAQLKP
jgi:hypothetical protein